MPELPEVKTVIDNLKTVCLNKNIANFIVYKPKILKEFELDYFKTNLLNKKIMDITNKGKLIIFHLNDGIFLYSHLRMEGKYSYYNKITNFSKHCMFKICFSDDSELHYNDSRMFGTLHIRNIFDDNYKNLSEPYSNISLEPKFLDPMKIYNKVKNSSVSIKTKILDQTLIAGIGNIYADEILFKEKIDPRTPTKNLTIDMWKNILKSADEIMTNSYKCGGTTIHTFESFNGKIGKYQDYLMVHSTKTNMCKICGTKISKIKVNGRGTYFCSNCQKLIGEKNG